MPGNYLGGYPIGQTRVWVVYGYWIKVAGLAQPPSFFRKINVIKNTSICGKCKKGLLE